MCFIMVGGFEPKRAKKKSRAESARDRAEVLNLIMNTDNSISRSIKRLESYIPKSKSLFQSMAEDEVRNREMGFY